MRARTGKIARLPGALRHELNRRLHNGALGRELVPWLNALPEVQSVLASRFAARPITEDNLSEWRRGGFQDWLLQEERRIRLRELSEQDHQSDPETRATALPPSPGSVSSSSSPKNSSVYPPSKIAQKDGNISSTSPRSCAACNTRTPVKDTCASSKSKPPTHATQNQIRV